jgi:hypothetical protein
MAENKRVRLEPHIEEYLKSHAQRVLDKPGNAVTSADLTTLTNALLYEHKLAQSMAKQIPFAKLFGWLMSWVPGSRVGLNQQVADVPTLKTYIPEPDNFEFDASLGDLYEEEAA